MNPKEKAKELVWKYLPILKEWKKEDSNKAKQCALIAVDEIIESKTYRDTPEEYEYWNEVKQEIEKL